MSNEGIGIKEEAKILFSIQKLQSELFGVKDPNRKIAIRKEIEDKEWELIGYKLGRENKYAELKELDKTKKEKRKPYFLWKLEFSRIFKEKGGFDIVIGNPPYIGFQKVTNKEYYKEKYISANGKYDFYVLFIENGLRLLKENGTISYICPSYFYKRNYGKNIRKLILDSTNIKFIADFNDSQIFDSATTYTCIFEFEKNSNSKGNLIRIIDKNLESNKYHTVEQSSLVEPVWMLENSDDMKIVNSIKKASKFNFGEITKSISQGIVTGNNSVFIINQDEINNKNINMSFLKPIYKGKDIRNGKLISDNQYVFYPYNTNSDGNNVLVEEEDIKNTNPHLYKYLLENKELLLSREYFRKSNKIWYELWNPRKKIHFNSRKFVFSEVNNFNDFVLCDECYYSDSACGAELKEDFKKYELYIQKYLNSNLITDLYRKLSVPKANGYLIYKNAFLKDLPIYLPINIDNIYSEILSMDKDEFEVWLCNELGVDSIE